MRVARFSRLLVPPNGYEGAVEYLSFPLPGQTSIEISPGSGGPNEGSSSFPTLTACISRCQVAEDRLIYTLMEHAATTNLTGLWRCYKSLLPHYCLPLLHIWSNINLIRKARPRLRMQKPIRIRNLHQQQVSPISFPSLTTTISRLERGKSTNLPHSD